MTDQEIIELIGKSKDQGFRVVVDMYKKPLYWHIRRMVYSHTESNDLLQNAFIKVWQNLDKFRAQSSLYTWIYRITTNEVLQWLRKTKHEHSDIHSVSESLFATHGSSFGYTEGEIEQILYEAISTLPEKQKLVFQMRYFDEMSYHQIAEVLKTSEGALKASYHHAVKKIEKILNEY